MSTIKPGDTLYEVRTVKQGNTTLTKKTCYAVSVREVHDDHVIASWNGNTPERMSSSRLSKMRRSRPASL
jgi:hypothetical protein